MAEEEVDSKKQVLRFAQEDKAFLSPKRSSRKSGGERSNPENGSIGLAALFQRVVEASLQSNPEVIGDCLLFHLRANNLKVLELLMDMVTRLGSNAEVSAGDYQSLAEMLMKACEEQGVDVAG